MDEGHTDFGRVGNVQDGSALNSLDGGGDGMGDVAVGGSGGMASGGVTSGGVSAVGDGVAAGGTVQSEIVIDGVKTGRTRKRVENLGLKVTLGVLMLAIVGLGVGVGVNVGEENEIQNNIGYYGAMANVLSRKILDKLEGEPGYTIEDAVADYEVEMNNEDNLWKVSVAFPYAWFVFEEMNDLDRAVGILESVEFIVDNELRSGYYRALRDMYGASGDVDMVEYYDRMMIEAGGLSFGVGTLA